jgi:hypothetical protein
MVMQIRTSSFLLGAAAITISTTGLSLLGGCAADGSSSTMAASGSGEPAPASASGASGAGQVAAGVLTAGMWDDALNYDFFGRYLDNHETIAGDPGFTRDDYAAAHARYAQRAPRTTVDAAIVLDTTGSMSDEIGYLRARDPDDHPYRGLSSGRGKRAIHAPHAMFRQ